MPPLNNSASPKEANQPISQIHSYTQHRMLWNKMRKEYPLGKVKISYTREKKQTNIHLAKVKSHPQTV